MFNNYANSISAFPMFGVGLGLFTVGAVLFFVLMLAIIALKGYALWNASKRDEKGWFVALLILNTFGILELVYLYFVVGKWKHAKDSSTTTTPPPTPTSTPPEAPTPSAQ